MKAGFKYLKRFVAVFLVIAVVFAAIAPIITVESEAAVTRVTRIYGNNRYDTAIRSANYLKKLQGVRRFETIIVACGSAYPDALSGSYLSYVTGAPILLVSEKYEETILEYIKTNLLPTGSLYILGGTGVVSQKFEDRARDLQIQTVERLGGANRYETNLKILYTADEIYSEKHDGEEINNILVCSAMNFPDALAGGATGWPIMLVKNDINSSQREYMMTREEPSYYILGGTGAVPQLVQDQIAMYDPVKRITGDNRYETSVNTAKEFFGETLEEVIVVTGDTFPDGLSAAPLAHIKKAPIVLANGRNVGQSYNYEKDCNVSAVTVMGGKAIIPNNFVATETGLVSGWNKVGDGWVYLNQNGRIETGSIKESAYTIVPNQGGYVPAASKAEIERRIDSATYVNGIVVHISDQMLDFVKNGNVIFSAPVVTGMEQPRTNKEATPKGTYWIGMMTRNQWLYGPSWTQFVNRWMGFTNGGRISSSEWGIHDAPWRKAFGGEIYKTDGSHGCVNMSVADAKWLFDNIKIGTKLVIK